MFEGDAEGKELQDEVPDVLAVIAVPASDRDNVLQHAVVAHEVGHAMSLRGNLDAYGKKVKTYSRGPELGCRKGEPKTVWAECSASIFFWPRSVRISALTCITRWMMGVARRHLERPLAGSHSIDRAGLQAGPMSIAHASTQLLTRKGHVEGPRHVWV